MVPQVEPVDRRPREVAAQQHVALRGAGFLGLAIALGDHLPEGDDGRVLAFDQQAHLGAVHRLGGEGVEQRDHHGDGERGAREPPPPVQRAQVVVEVHGRPPFGIGPQKNFTGTRIVSSRCTGSSSCTGTSICSPSTMRMTVIRLSAANSVAPPASESACSTVMPGSIG